MKTLAQRFIYSRERAGLTQSELAQRAGVSQTSISKIESGETQKPKDINRYAKILRVSSDYLETGEEPETGDTSLQGLSYSAADLVSLIQDLDKKKSIPDEVYRSLKTIILAGFSQPSLAAATDNLSKGLDSKIRE